MTAPQHRNGWAPTTGDEPDGVRRIRHGLAGLLTFMTALHVARPELFLPMIPDWVPGEREALHHAATAAEGVSAALLWNRRTRRLGGAAAALTFLAVFPANVDAAVRGGYRGAPGWLSTRAAAIARLPLQVPLVWWAHRVFRGR